MRQTPYFLIALTAIAALMACGFHRPPSVPDRGGLPELARTAPRAPESRPALAGLSSGVARRQASRGAANPPPGIQPKAPQLPGRVRLGTGKLLVATRQLNGPFFTETVVLLLDYSPEGALGLIVNRPTKLALTELLPELEKIGDRDDTVYLGGPVNPEWMVFLIRSDQAPPDSRRVVEDVHATGSPDALRLVVKQNAPATRFHAYVGYAGWSPGQLDAEVMRGDWYVAEARPEHIFDPKLSDLWKRLVVEHEGLHVRAEPEAGWSIARSVRAGGQP